VREADTGGEATSSYSPLCNVLPTSPRVDRLEFHSTGHKGSKLSYVPIRTGLGVMSVAEVRLQEGESLENALRRFKRKVQTEDIIKEVKRHS
jgi:hypothetical protein